MKSGVKTIETIGPFPNHPLQTLKAVVRGVALRKPRQKRDSSENVGNAYFEAESKRLLNGQEQFQWDP